MAAPKYNTNAEKWTEELAEKFFLDAINLSQQKDEEGAYQYDFIGEVARELDSYKEVFTYLRDKFKSLKPLHNKLVSTLESNCFYNSKKGNIREATAIVNLKSNHGWTDRTEQKIDMPEGQLVIRSKGKRPQVD